MSKISFNRAEILKSLNDLILGVVSDTVFVNDRPAATQKQLSDFATVRLSQGITDRGDTYQTSYIQIAVFARNRANGQEDTVKLDSMAAKVTDLFPISNELFIATTPKLLPGGDDGLGFHSLIIQSRLIIKKPGRIEPTTI